MPRCCGRPEVAAADWMLICDADEFLVLHRGDGSIGAFLDDLGRDHLGVAFHWRCFGSSGWDRYEDGLVHRQFQRCGPGGHGAEHHGQDPDPDAAAVRAGSRTTGPWRFEGRMGEGRNVIVDADGRVIDRFSTAAGPVRFTARAEITHRAAQMNHYVIRSEEHFAMKRGRPSASSGKDRYTEQFYRARNRNGHRDASALGPCRPVRSDPCSGDGPARRRPAASSVLRRLRGAAVCRTRRGAGGGPALAGAYGGGVRGLCPRAPSGLTPGVLTD